MVAICLVEEAICAKCLETDRRTTDAARWQLIPFRNELKVTQS